MGDGDKGKEEAKRRLLLTGPFALLSNEFEDVVRMVRMQMGDF